MTSWLPYTLHSTPGATATKRGCGSLPLQDLRSSGSTLRSVTGWCWHAISLLYHLQELEETGQQKQSLHLSKLQAPVIRSVKQSIGKIEAAIDDLIATDVDVKAVIQSVSSIKGVGKQTAINLYVYTKGFTVFENAKQLACYCGAVYKNIRHLCAP